MTRKTILLAVCIGALLISSMAAWSAGQAGFSIKATSGDMVATWTESFAADSTYTLASPYDLVCNGTKLGTINSFSAGAIGDPVLTLAFAFSNQSDQPLTFTVTTIMQNLNITNPECAASAAFTLTDGSNPGNGATATGLFDGLIYQARTNNGTFANLIPSFSADRSASDSQLFPASGFVSGGPTVTSMILESSFVLSGKDLASGTARFECRPAEAAVPEPASVLLGLLGLSGIAGYMRIKK